MTELHKKLVYLLEQADQATDRKTVIRLINQADRVRAEMLEQYSGHPDLHG